MVSEQLVVQPRSRADTASDFSAWVRDYQRSLLGFAQLIAGHPQTGEDLLQTALARAYLKWSKIGAAGQDPVGYVRRIIVNENASLWRHAWKRRERSTAILPEPTEPGRRVRRPDLVGGPGAATTATHRDRPAVLRRSHRGRDRDGDGLLAGLGEDAHVSGRRQTQAGTRRRR